MENGKKPVYPSKGYRHSVMNDGETQVGDLGFMQFHGLTKREYFAAVAMQGLMTTLIPLTDNQACPNYDNVKYCANLAATAADELLKALETKSE